MLREKNILLCVTGGIAVYKAAALTSKLAQTGANVKVIMSQSATEFVTPLTFQVLSKNEVYTNTFIENDPGVISHIDLADWADLVLVAPATANTIGKLANGIADTMITTVLLATTAKVWIAPAMNVHMYAHPAVKQNMETLSRHGYRFIEPNAGHLACGHVGKGRMEEPEKLLELLKEYFNKKETDLSGKKVVITAGPTREKIDPVRFMTNYSTGKMGYAIAEEAVEAGAEVVLISGPVHISPPHGVHFIPAESAAEMYDAVFHHFDDAHVIIKSAAVADYRPKMISDQKMKKGAGDLFLELERTKDILYELGQQKTNQILIGFAAETENIFENATKKLLSKNVDLIVANDLTEAGAGFAGDTNKVTIFKRDGNHIDLPLLSKRDVAQRIFKEVSNIMKDEPR